MIEVQTQTELDLETINLKSAWEYVGGLSKPSKMPGYGYGISAKNCITGSKLRKVKNSVCSKCYALKGRYVFDNTVNAHKKRLISISKPYWVFAMSFLINFKKNNPRGKDTSVFRWHDSGDLQSIQHLYKIVSVVRNTPTVRHWLPTREVNILKAFLASGNTIPSNLTIRLSATTIGKDPREQYSYFQRIPNLLFSGVNVEGVQECKAYTQGGVCGDCRECWSTKHKIISYPLH
jgi:hypothetical protein